jgi:hypothetical protein
MSGLASRRSIKQKKMTLVQDLEGDQSTARVSETEAGIPLGLSYGLFLDAELVDPTLSLKTQRLWDIGTVP